METQIVIVNGRTRRAKTKFGSEHITFFVDVPVSEADYFAKKCSVLGKTKSNVLRDLILEFNRTFGIPAEDRVKDPGSLFERRSIKHIKEAVKEKVKREFPWIFSEN
jgi:hypothetical protein